MANVDKIIKSKNQPKQTNVAWVDLSGETPIEKHFINGRWAAVSGGGTSDYTDIKNKPSINNVTLEGNITTQQLGVDKHFKGWYNTLAELKAAHTAVEGDSAYVKDASPATTWSIYVYDSTASSDNYWADSGTNADTSNVQTFASGEEVNETPIDNTHLVNPADGALPTAADVMQLKAKLKGVTAEETKVTQAPITGSYVRGADGSIATANNVSYIETPLGSAKSVRFLGAWFTSSGYTSGYAFGHYADPTDPTTWTTDKSSVFDTNASVLGTKEYIVEKPEGSTHLRTTTATGSVPALAQNFYCYLQSGDTVEQIKDTINGKKDYVDVAVTLKANKCWRNDGTLKSTTPLSDCYCGVLGNVAGRKFRIYGKGYSGEIIPLVFFRKSNGEYISGATIQGEHYGGIDFTAPINAYFMQFNFANYINTRDRLQEYIQEQEGLEQEVEKKLYGTTKWVELTPSLYDGYYLYEEGKSYLPSNTHKCFRIDGVKTGDKYKVWGSTAVSIRIVMFKNASGVVLTNGTASGSSNVTFTDVPYECEVPKGAYYMFVNYYDYDSSVNKIEKLVQYIDGVEQIAQSAETIALYGSKLVGKNIVFFGDSITQFYQQGRNIPAWFGEYSGANVVGGAIGGTRLVPRPSTETYSKLDIPNMIDAWIAGDFTEQIAAAGNTSEKQLYERIIEELISMPISDTNIVMIGGGTNDMASGSPIGTSTDITTATMLGSIAHIITVLLTAKPSLKIYFYSPVVGKHGDPLTFDDAYVFPLIGKTKPEVIELLAAQAKRYHVPYIDLYWSMGWNELNFSTYFTLSGDNSHPYGGFNALARRLYGQVCSLME